MRVSGISLSKSTAYLIVNVNVNIRQRSLDLNISLDILKTFDNIRVSRPVGQSVAGVASLNRTQTFIQSRRGGLELHVLSTHSEIGNSQSYLLGG